MVAFDSASRTPMGERKTFINEQQRLGIRGGSATADREIQWQNLVAGVHHTEK